MSKLYEAYTQLKKTDSKTIYLFKSGIFFIALNEDAELLSNLFDLKINNLTTTVVKAGFPCNSYEKYCKLFKTHNLTVKIVDMESFTKRNFKEYSQSQSLVEIIDKLNKVDPNNLSITEAYKFIEDLKEKVIKIWKEKEIYIQKYANSKTY